MIRVYSNKSSSRGQFISNYLISPSPHISSGESVAKIMWIVNATLIPAILSSIFYYGITAFYIITVAVVSAVIAEVISNVLRKEEGTISDGSAVLTGLLLALSLSPGMELTKVSLGSFFAIIIGKQLFGGLGYNIFNPALIGRAFLQISFPVEMTSFYSMIDRTKPAFFMNEIDGVTSATSLAALKFDGNFTRIEDLFWGNHSGAIGETSAAMLLLGVAVLVYKRYINLLVPLSIFMAVAVVAGITSTLHPEKFGGVFFNLLSGGMIFGSFYMATDMVTSPVTTKGVIIFGIGIGLVTMLIRLGGGMTEGFMYSVLIMNSLVPLINRYTRPGYFGEEKK